MLLFGFGVSNFFCVFAGGPVLPRVIVCFNSVVNFAFYWCVRVLWFVFAICWFVVWFDCDFFVCGWV